MKVGPRHRRGRCVTTISWSENVDEMLDKMKGMPPDIAEYIIYISRFIKECMNIPSIGMVCFLHGKGEIVAIDHNPEDSLCVNIDIYRLIGTLLRKDVLEHTERPRGNTSRSGESLPILEVPLKFPTKRVLYWALTHPLLVLIISVGIAAGSCWYASTFGSTDRSLECMAAHTIAILSIIFVILWGFMILGRVFLGERFRVFPGLRMDSTPPPPDEKL